MTRAALAGVIVLACAVARVRADDERAMEASHASWHGLFGMPCDTPVEGALRVVCGARRRIALIALPVDFLFEPPASAERVHVHPVPRDATGNLLVVAITTDTLWVHEVTCARCRRVMGTTTIVDLPRVRAADLRALQAHLGLPDARPLRTTDAWRDAYAPR